MLIDRSGPIPDPWPRVEGDAALPAQGLALVDLDRLGEARAAGLTVGVHLPNTTDPRGLAGALDGVALVSVAFPSFADGRGFSIARCLRALGFAGRLRATGPVIADQFGYLLEAGFDEAKIPDDVARRQPPEQWLATLARVTLGYQRGVGGGRGSILDRRHGHG